MSWYFGVLRKYAVFEGRACRKEIWMFILVSLIISVALGIVDGLTGLCDESTSVGVLSTAYGIAVFLPTLAVGARRLHDTGRSAWWLLLGIIPIIGAIVLIVFYAIEGDRGPNEYGPDPKEERQPTLA